MSNQGGWGQGYGPPPGYPPAQGYPQQPQGYGPAPQHPGYGPPPAYGVPAAPIIVAPAAIPIHAAAAHGYGMAAWTCPYCRWSGHPNALGRESKTTTAGWVVFFVLLFMCFPLCFLGLNMKTHTTKCPGCGTPAGRS